MSEGVVDSAPGTIRWLLKVFLSAVTQVEDRKTVIQEAAYIRPV